MNETKIEWCDKTINPAVGCTHGCTYCYARRRAKRQLHNCKKCYEFKPHFHPERLEQLNPRQKSKRIFIDSMWDWNCKENAPLWHTLIRSKMQECKQHTFIILSKRPEGYADFEFTKNVWIGATITNNQDYYRATDFLHCGAGKRFVSIEPLHGPIPAYCYEDLDWVIVGAETGNRKDKIVPEPTWIEDIIKHCREWSIPIFLKNNLEWPEQIQEFP